MKIKNLQIFLRQKGATTWRNSGLSPGNPTQHFRNYNFVQDVAFLSECGSENLFYVLPPWNQPLVGEYVMCAKQCVFFEILFFYFSDHHTHSKWVKLRPEKKTTNKRRSAITPWKHVFEKRPFPLGKADFRASCNKPRAWIQGFSFCLIGPFLAKAQEGTTCCRWLWFITAPML